MTKGWLALSLSDFAGKAVIRMTKVSHVLNEVFDISLAQAAELVGVSAGTTVQRWANETSEPPKAFFAKLGISHDWYDGTSGEMWNARVHAIRRELASYLESVDASSMSPSERFRLVVTWLLDNASDIATPKYLAAILRMLDRFGRINAFHDMASGLVPASESAISRLADWTKVPQAWFYDGKREHVAGDAYNAVAAEARLAGIPADVLRGMIRTLKTYSESR